MIGWCDLIELAAQMDRSTASTGHQADMVVRTPSQISHRINGTDKKHQIYYEIEVD